MKLPRDCRGAELLELLYRDFGYVQIYRAGELEQSRDFIQWTGDYQAKLERGASYRQLMYEHVPGQRRDAAMNRKVAACLSRPR